MKIPIISRLLERRNTPDLLNPKQWLIDALVGRKAVSGVYVTEETSLKFMAVYAAVRIISETIASLPLRVYRRLDNGGKEKAPDHSLYRILHDSPNPEMTAFTYRETVMAHLLSWGNSYSEMVKNGYGETLELWPLLPGRMRVERIGGVLIYRYTLPNGTETVIPTDFILHIPALGYDGRMGYSPIRMAQEAIGMGLALEEFGARFFTNATNIGGVAEHPGQLGKQAHENLEKSLQEKYEGLGKSHRLLILEEGMKYQKVTIPPNEAQFIESRRFQLEEVARIYRVPKHLLQDLTHATFSNIEHQSIDFVVHCIRPWLVRLEQVYNLRLFRSQEKKSYFAEHCVDGLLRGDIKSRYEAYHTARMDGWLNADEIRELENLNPMEDEQGRVYTVPLNMVNLKSITDSESGSGELILSGGDSISGFPLRSITSKTGGLSRQNIAHSYRKIIEDGAERVVRREAERVKKLARQIFTIRSMRNLDKFSTLLEELYSQFGDYLKKQVSPSFSSLAEAISSQAQTEAGNTDEIAAEVNKFMQEYVEAFSQRYIDSSRGQLISTVRKASEAKEDPLEYIFNLLGQWQKTRPGIVSRNENVKINGAVSRVTWTFSGVRELVWRNTGNKTCAYCNSMSGKVVGIEEKFVPANVDFKPLGADGSLKIRGPKSHPPLHQGCDCIIEISG